MATLTLELGFIWGMSDYTIERHAGARGLPAVMIEIDDEEGERRWADRLADSLSAAERTLALASRTAGRCLVV